MFEPRRLSSLKSAYGQLFHGSSSKTEYCEVCYTRTGKIGILTKRLKELRNPSALLRTFFAALGSEERFYQCEGNSVFESLFELSRNPLEFRKMAFRLTNIIPDDTVGGRQKAEASTDKQLTLSMATEMLKLVFFRLSNGIVPKFYWHERDIRAHDRFVLHLVEAVSRTNSEMSAFIFSSHCTTADAIKEAVYGSAIRERNYTIISHLLDSGIDPNRNITTYFGGLGYIIERGMIKLMSHCPNNVFSGIYHAGLTCDTRLAKILLNAGASIDIPCVEPWSALDIAAASASDSSVEFVQLLLEHGALSDRPTSCRRCRRMKLILPIATSIAKRNKRMEEFLIEKRREYGSI